MPLCLIVNFGSESEEVLVKEILFKGQKIVDNQSNECGSFTWEVNNKYYTCSVRVRVEENITTDRLSPSAAPEALVMYAGRSPVNWRNMSPKLKKIHGILGCVHIKLLVAQSFKDDSTRLEAQEWAVDEGFEIVDFSEDADNVGVEEKLFASSSQGRVIEALQTCPWPNIQTKKNTEHARDSPETGSVVGTDGGSNDQEDNFEALFAQLSTFRDRSTNMRDEERKAFAESMAVQFFNAIGGEDSSDDEIKNECIKKF